MAILEQNKVSFVAQEMNAFLNSGEKSIQRNYTFTVSIFDQVQRDSTSPMPDIQTYHVIDINFPTFSFKKEKLQTGLLPTTFPVYDGEGFEFTITFEEDDNSTIQTFINWCQRQILTYTGLVNPPFISKPLMIGINIYDVSGQIVMSYRFDRCFFISVDDTKLDYRTHDSIKYNVKFGSDYYEIKKYNKIVE
jgi:hypothetical protein